MSHISVKEIRDCFDLRVSLETLALETACERMSVSDLDGLTGAAATEYVPDDWDSYVDFLEHNLEFHLRLAELSENARLVAVLRDLLWSMQRFFFLGLDLGDFAAEMRTEHQELLDLLRAGERETAVECLRNQIATSRTRILRALAESGVELPLK